MAALFDFLRVFFLAAACYHKIMKRKFEQWAATREWWVLGVILAVFSAVVLGNITRWSIWFDEAFSAYLMRFDAAKIVHFTALDVHPPLYYLLLKGWTSIFGNSLLAVRSMSLALALVGLVGLYFVVWHITKSRQYGLAAVAAAALTPTLVRFSEEARMYTLVFAIVVWATYVLLRAVETNRRWLWVVYGGLLAASIYTHYFTALAWLAHWVWRYYEKRSGRVEKFFSREWVWCHVFAVGLFAVWLPVAARQFAMVQIGFWIPPITPQTPINYLTDMLFYREVAQMDGWWAIGAFAAFATLGAALYFGWTKLAERLGKGGASLLALMVIAPLVLLTLASLPPLKSSFVNRYVLYAQVLLAAVLALCLLAIAKTRPNFARYGAIIMTLVALIGICDVYYYGNYNKTTRHSIRTSELVAKIASAGEAGQPIISATPWIYYEASFYDSSEHPVYYLESTTRDDYGSLAMLKEDDTGRISDVAAFTKQYRYVWYFDTTKNEIKPPVASWKLVKKVDVYDPINGETEYRAGLYDTSAE